MCVFWARSSLLESALRGPGLLGVRRIEGLGGRQQIQDFTKSSLSVFLATEASGSSALRALARPGLDCGPDLNLQRPCHCRFVAGWLERLLRNPDMLVPAIPSSSPQCILAASLRHRSLCCSISDLYILDAPNMRWARPLYEGQAGQSGSTLPEMHVWEAGRVCLYSSSETPFGSVVSWRRRLA